MDEYGWGASLPDGVAGSHTDPLWDWPVLLHGSPELGLDVECLVRRPACEGETGRGGGRGVLQARRRISTCKQVVRGCTQVTVNHSACARSYCAATTW